MAQKIVKLFFDGEEKECLVQTADNGEIVCTARDGQFVKFPAGSDVDAEVAKHNADESNTIVPVSGEEEAAKKAELFDWLDEDARTARNLSAPAPAEGEGTADNSSPVTGVPKGSSEADVRKGT